MNVENSYCNVFLFSEVYLQIFKIEENTPSNRTIMHIDFMKIALLCLITTYFNVN